MSANAFLFTMICTICYVFQGFFNKLFTKNYEGSKQATTSVFVIIYSVITVVATFLYSGCVFAPASVTVIFGVINGIVLFLFNLSQIGAAKTGPFSFQSLMLVAGNIILPMLFATLFWGDRITLLQGIGILLMGAAIYVFNMKGMTLKGRKKGYFGWVCLLFGSNGLYGILLDSQQRLMDGTERNEMIIISFAVAMLISLVYLIIKEGKNTGKAFKMNGKAWASVLLASLGSAVAINLLMYTLSLAPVSILLTVLNGALFLVQALLSVIVLKEKFTWTVGIGAVIALLSMVLLNI